MSVACDWAKTSDLPSAKSSLTDNPGLGNGELLCPCPPCWVSGLASTIVDRSEPRPPNIKRRVISALMWAHIGPVAKLFRARFVTELHLVARIGPVGVGSWAA